MKNVVLILLAIIAITSCNSLDKKSDKMKIEQVKFKSEGLQIVGNLYYPENFDSQKQYPAIVVTGSWTTVKEQMSGLYAEKFAKEGFITLAFDFRNYGESEGEPRFYENPILKIADIKNAITYLQTLKQVDSNKLAAFAVCAGAGYTLVAASEDNRIKSVVTAASWLHDSEAVKMFYGGEEGVNAKVEAARNAKKKYAETGETEYIPTISLTDQSAAMFGNYDYYLNPKRGAIKQWSADKFAVMSWEDWLHFEPMPSAQNLKIPTLMIHTDGCVLPDYTKKYFANIATDKKKLHWINSEIQSPFEQFNFYDQAKEVNLTIELATKWFNDTM